jgi:DNA polymerase-1
MAQLVNEHVTLVNTMTETVLDPRAWRKSSVSRRSCHRSARAHGRQGRQHSRRARRRRENRPGSAAGPRRPRRHLRGPSTRSRRLGFRGAKTMAAKLEKERDNAYLSYRLATIATDLDLPMKHTDDLKTASPTTRDACCNAVPDLEFKSWLEELERDGPGGAADGDTAGAGRPTTTRSRRGASTPGWRNCAGRAVRLRHGDHQPGLHAGGIVGVSFAVAPGEAAYVPWPRYPGGAGAARSRRGARGPAPAARRRRARPRSARTSSTTPACWRATVSRCAASPSTPCSSPTSSTPRPRATTWTAWR